MVVPESEVSTSDIWSSTNEAQTNILTLSVSYAFYHQIENVRLRTEVLMKQPHVAHQERRLCVIRCDVRSNSLEQSPSEAVSLSGNQEMPSLYETRCILPLVPVLNIRVAFKHRKFSTVFLSAFVYRIHGDDQYELQKCRGGKQCASLGKFAKSRRLDANTSCSLTRCRKFWAPFPSRSWHWTVLKLKNLPIFLRFCPPPPFPLFIHMKLLAFVTSKLLRFSRRLWMFTNSISRQL
jgi:hypothetical protein